jgi:hypothetical protein
VCDVRSLAFVDVYVMPFWYDATRYISVVAFRVYVSSHLRHVCIYEYVAMFPLYIRLQAVPHKQLVLSVAAFLRDRELGASFLESLPGLDMSELLDPLAKVSL